MDYASSRSGVTIDLSAGRAAANDRLYSIENVLGSPYNDVITGSDGPNTLKGMAGNDSFIGGGGDDVLLGGPGVDTINGGTGFNRCKAETTTGCSA